MNHPQITFSAELNDNQITIELTCDNNDQELAIKAANELFASLEQVGIEVTRKNLEKDWRKS
ncbi:MAG: hypothetical protein AAF652_11280 [Cyanobacteria bacterium P01_C01_bin.72]